MEPQGETGQFNYNTEDTPVQVAPELEANKLEIEWQASEFIDHQKSAGWFLVLAGATVVGVALMFLITRSYLSTAVVVLAVITFGMIAKQKPRSLRYALLTKTIQIDQREYIYDDFSTFSVNQDGGLPSISLQPIKRFVPVLTIYFAPEDGEKIFDIFASHLPHENRKEDPVDKLMKRIRF